MIGPAKHSPQARQEAFRLRGARSSYARCGVCVGHAGEERQRTGQFSEGRGSRNFCFQQAFEKQQASDYAPSEQVYRWDDYSQALATGPVSRQNCCN